MMMKTSNDMITEIILLLLVGIKNSWAVAAEMNYERAEAAVSASFSQSSVSLTSAANCPRGCQCLNSDVLTCVGRNLTQPPIPIEDSKASDLLLASNKIAQIDLVFLKHYPSLRLLSLHDNGLR